MTHAMAHSSLTRSRVRVRGLVQGVGFRPFIHNLAGSFGLTGWVLNDSDGVLLEVQGGDCSGFLQSLNQQAPPLARIEGIEVLPVSPEPAETGFEIRASVLAAAPPAPPSARTPVSAKPALPSCSIRKTAAGAIPSSTAPIAAPATPSPARCPMTGRRPPWRVSPSARTARTNTTTRATGVSMLSQPPARPVAPNSPCGSRKSWLAFAPGKSSR